MRECRGVRTAKVKFDDVWRGGEVVFRKESFSALGVST